MKQTLIAMLLCLACSTQTVLAQTQDYDKYEGKIGTFAITLFFNPRAFEQDSCGYYIYNERPKTHFRLKIKHYEAKMREDATGMPVAWGHHYILEEYTPKGNHTGTFDGIAMQMGDTFDGIFTNKKGERFDFQLVQQFEK